MGFLHATYHLFSIHQPRKKFKLHRIWGLLYLFQFAFAVYGHAKGDLRWTRTVFWTMPVTGFLQSIIASKTFHFLPKADDKEQGYYHETKVMSHDFVVENIYFAGLLLWQSVYLCFAGAIRANPLLLPVEILMNFFPYLTLRDLFPKSSFRNSTKNGNRYASFVKVFYVFAKHFSGFYVNYLCFLGAFGDVPILDYKLHRNLLLLGGWGTTIAMFLQTLKFKRLISPTAAMILYAGSFPFFYAGYVALIYSAFDHVWLTVLTLIGMAVNFKPRSWQIVWQTFMCAVLLSYRLGMLNNLLAMASSNLGVAFVEEPLAPFSCEANGTCAA